MGALCLSTAEDEAMVFDTSDGPMVIIGKRGRRRRAAIEWRIVAPPAVEIVRGRFCGAVVVNAAIVEAYALQREGVALLGGAPIGEEECV